MPVHARHKRRPSHSRKRTVRACCNQTFLFELVQKYLLEDPAKTAQFSATKSVEELLSSLLNTSRVRRPPSLSRSCPHIG